MLPVTLQFLIAMVAPALNERIARRVEYLREEVRVLEESLVTATGKTRLSFTPEQRRRLALKGKALNPQERAECCQVVRPETILAWFRQLAAKKYDSSGTRKVGRARKANEVRDLVLKLDDENLGWGYTKTRDALRGLKIQVCRTTVANILAEPGIEPAPERYRQRTRKHFLSSHWETLYACDFISVETLGVFGTVRQMVFFVIELRSRSVQMVGLRIAPDGTWMLQMARNLLDSEDGFLRHATHLIHDRDPLFYWGFYWDAEVQRRRGHSHSSAESELQRLRGKVCKDSAKRVFGSLCDLRGTASAASDEGIRAALRHGALSPRVTRSTHSPKAGARQR